MVASRTQALNLGRHNHKIRDPADAALELAIRKAAGEGRRTCIVCAEEKPLEAYPKAGRGRSYRCRDCTMKAASRIGEQIDRRTIEYRGQKVETSIETSQEPEPEPEPEPLNAHAVAEETAETAERVAGIARGVTALNDAIRGAQGPAEDESDPDVEHADLLEPAVTESIKRFVRGTVKGTAALMVRDMVRGAVRSEVGPAVREAAAAIVPELVTEALTVEMRKLPTAPAVATETPAEIAPHSAQHDPATLPALVTALLERQPLQQRGWGCATERARWLAAFTAVLDLVFPVADGVGDSCVAVEEVTHVRV